MCIITTRAALPSLFHASTGWHRENFAIFGSVSKKFKPNYKVGYLCAHPYIKRHKLSDQFRRNSVWQQLVKNVFKNFKTGEWKAIAVECVERTGLSRYMYSCYWCLHPHQRTVIKRLRFCFRDISATPSCKPPPPPKCPPVSHLPSLVVEWRDTNTAWL
jgi:hypothetical protein